MNDDLSPNPAKSNGSADLKASENAVQDAARRFSATATDVANKVYDQATEAGKFTSKQIQDQPLAAAAIFGVVGLLLGFILGQASASEPRSIGDYAQAYLPRGYRKR